MIFTMEIERKTFTLAIIFIHISRRVTTAQDSNEGQEQRSYFFQSVELSFWIALGLAFSVIVTCLCCIFCLKRKTLVPQGQMPNNNREQTTGEGRGNGAFEFSDPPPPYSDALKYALSKDNEGLPEYSDTYL